MWNWEVFRDLRGGIGLGEFKGSMRDFNCNLKKIGEIPESGCADF